MNLEEGEGGEGRRERGKREGGRGEQGHTYISLKHVVVFFLGTERFLQDHDVPLVVCVLFLEGLHLGRECEDLLVPLLDLQPRLFELGEARQLARLLIFHGYVFF